MSSLPKLSTTSLHAVLEAHEVSEVYEAPEMHQLREIPILPALPSTGTKKPMTYADERKITNRIAAAKSNARRSEMRARRPAARKRANKLHDCCLRLQVNGIFTFAL